jgi:hypothetical protein
VLCRYHYDALNRLTASAPSAQASVQRFYLKDRLSTEIQGAVQRSIMQHEDQLLAQRNAKPPPCKPTSWPRINSVRC